MFKKSMNKKKLLQSLIQIPSYSGKEEKLAAFIAQWVRELGLRPMMVDGNLIIYLPGANGRKCLIFDTHLDTIKAQDLSLWNYPPFGKQAGVIDGGRVYGLGASDAKGSIVSFLLFLKKLCYKKPACDVWLALVVKEETDGAGTLKFLDWFNKGIKGRYQEIAAVVGEPTDLKTIEIGHRGSVFLQITTRGESGHAANSSKIKTQAVEQMFQVFTSMKVWEENLKINYSDKLFGCPSICLTKIHSLKGAANQIPATCSSTWDIRTTPKLHHELVEGGALFPPSSPGQRAQRSQTIEILRPASLAWDEAGAMPHLKLVKGKAWQKMVLCQWWEKRIAKAVEKGDLKVDLLYFSPPGYTKPGEKIIQVFKKAVPEVRMAISSFSNDLGYFEKAGIPAVVFGPGQNRLVHKENEYVEIESVVGAAAIYQQVLKIFAT